MKIIDKLRSFIPKNLQGHATFFAAIVCILILATLKNSPHLGVITSYDKFNHLAAFFALSFVFELTYPELHPAVKVGYLVGFSVCIEVIQAFIPWRSAEFNDVVAGCLGVVLFYLCCYLVDCLLTLVTPNKN
ncbi:MAG: VanZ family protein [Lentisphaeria bacterium]|nr:VanZ family protein [Lentisphaeria bacterium]